MAMFERKANQCSSLFEEKQHVLVESENNDAHVLFGFKKMMSLDGIKLNV